MKKAGPKVNFFLILYARAGADMRILLQIIMKEMSMDLNISSRTNFKRVFKGDLYRGGYIPLLKR